MEKNNHIIGISMIAIVAIVAVVGMIGNFNIGKSNTVDNLNLGGDAIRMSSISQEAQPVEAKPSTICTCTGTVKKYGNTVTVNVVTSKNPCDSACCMDICANRWPQIDFESKDTSTK